MPPANSPVRNGTSRPPRTPSPFSYLPALQQLASPVPDLASTLTVQADNDIDALSGNFDRRHSTSSDRDAASTTDAFIRELRNERRRRDGIARPRSINEETWSRYTPEQRLAIVRDRREREEAWAASMMNPSRAALHDAYGARIPPATHQQSLYDWAPAYDRTEAQHLSDIIAELHRQQPNTHPEILRALARAHLDQEREQRIARLQSLANSSHNDASSLRSAAILQSVRRNQRLSARSTPHHFLDREGSLHDADRERWYRRALGLSDGSRYELSRQAWRNSQTSSGTSSASQHAAMRSQCLETSSHDVPSKHRNFGYIIEWMHLCMNASDEDPARDFDDRGHSPRRRSSAGHAETILCAPNPPQPTSWLASGMHFSGSQRTTTEIGAPQPGTSGYHASVAANGEPRRLSQHHARDEMEARPNFDPSRPWLGQGLTATPLRFAAQPATTSSTTPFQDRWTVKVAIHAVDYDNMTLQGTMEAFNVPSVTPHRPSGGRTTTPTGGGGDGSSSSKTTFSTYLEGEIIDFKQHTLLTVPSKFSVNTTPETDAAYWRKLEPFASLQEDELGRAVLDRKWIEEELMGKYVLMRWKERCFVKPTLTSFHTDESNSANIANASPTLRPDPLPSRDTTTSFLHADGNTFGLSISGFYYVSLRRSDGKCEGLYMDPQSSPYQHLELSPTSMHWTRGAWEFR